VKDAAARGIGAGDRVTVRSNGSSVELQARIARSLAPGHARVAAEHCRKLGRYVEVDPA
jgi:anaerobic selenocysteine-containing dehydrogenase